MLALLQEAGKGRGKSKTVFLIHQTAADLRIINTSLFP